MQLPTKKNFLEFTIKVGAFLLVLAAAYFFLFIRPQILAPARALVAAEKLVAVHHLNLVENRSSFVWLTKLDYGSTGFVSDKQHILSRLTDTNAEGIRLASEIDVNSVKIKKAPELSESFENTVQECGVVYSEQKKLLAALTEFDERTQNIFLYNPQNDLGQLNFTTERGALLTRSITAKDALADISKNLESPKNFPAPELLIEHVNESILLLEDLVTSLEAQEFPAAEEARKQFITQFDMVQKTARDIELNLLRSDDSIKLATRQANLIAKLEYLLQEIHRLHNEL